MEPLKTLLKSILAAKRLIYYNRVMKLPIGIAQKAIVWNKDKTKFLTLLRGKTAPHGPLTWDLPGGDMESGEDPVESILREIEEETKLSISNIKPFDVEAHESDNEWWVTIAYEAIAENEDVTISWEHDEYRWVTKEEFFELPSRKKIIRFISSI